MPKFYLIKFFEFLYKIFFIFVVWLVSILCIYLLQQPGGTEQYIESLLPNKIWQKIHYYHAIIYYSIWFYDILCIQNSNNPWFLEPLTPLVRRKAHIWSGSFFPVCRRKYREGKYEFSTSVGMAWILLFILLSILKVTLK